MAIDQDRSIYKHFKNLHIPKQGYRHHKPIDIITMAIFRYIGNAGSFEFMAELGRAKHDGLVKSPSRIF